MKVKKLWDRSPHNAFTDLVTYRERLFCVFREGQSHISDEATLRILVSNDGEAWETASTVGMKGADLRDPKLCLAPNGHLLLTSAGVHRLDDSHLQTYTWYSEGGLQWSKPQPIGQVGEWLWRLCWVQGVGLCLGYSEQGVRLYRVSEGGEWIAASSYLLDQDFPNESEMINDGEDGCLCLLRRDKGEATALLGHSTRPFEKWSWTDLGKRIGGPHLTRAPNGDLLAVVRFYDDSVRTSVCRLNKDEGRLAELLSRPSGGDCSYAGSQFLNGNMLISYYSGHEGNCAIYLATIPLEDIGCG